uniref:Dienelactone hydrolase-like protein n=1 Tax=Klebsiella pneumoniae TaxID=573 RepID=A0A8B0SRQ6_KLEPN|nr:Dienelactone hydrolase-like protein [Klebsiella pneumoniae]
MFVGVNRVLSDAESKSFFSKKTERSTQRWTLKIPFLTVRETLLYKPALNASQVMCPTLIVIAGQDTVNPPEQGRALFDAVGGPKKKRLYEESSARHYDIYAGEHF